jgi:uncharacterized protein
MTAFKDLYGPWALVTGASAGIGAEFARQLAALGLNLILIARRQQRLKELAQELEDKNKIQARIVAIDLSRPDFLPEILAVTQRLDVGLVVNNAGFGIAGKFLDHDIERELALLAVNCRAPLALTHAFGREMARRNKGGIIFVSSVSAYIATPFEATYAASKAFELFLAEAFGYEFRNTGVQVLALCPGSTDTEFHEISGSSAVAAMPAQPVVKLALRKLGKKPVAIPGWHNRFLVYTLKFTPRRLQSFLAGRVMAKLI